MSVGPSRCGELDVVAELFEFDDELFDNAMQLVEIGMINENRPAPGVQHECDIDGSNTINATPPTCGGAGSSVARRPHHQPAQWNGTNVIGRAGCCTGSVTSSPIPAQGSLLRPR